MSVVKLLVGGGLMLLSKKAAKPLISFLLVFGK
jgi:hypothetical protein